MVSPAGVSPGAPAVVVAAHGVAKTFQRGAETVHALRGTDIEVRAGEVVGVSGASGSGKSTLLAVLCGWEHPESGEVRHVDGQVERLLWSSLAIVPQTLGLLHDLTVRENIELSGRLTRKRGREPGRTDYLMDKLGLTHLAGRYPNQVSVGEQQRTSVARGLYLRPALTLADEPTAHQDAGFGQRVLDTIRDHAGTGGAFLIVSHDRQTLDACDRVLTMRDGTLA